MSDLRLKVPCTLIISSPSKGGKTHLTARLLTEPGCFTEKFEEIKWIYARHADDPELFQRLKHLPIEFIEGYPEEKIVNNNLFTCPRSSHKLLILDDVFTGPKKIDSLFDIFNITSHHQNISAIVNVQNLSGQTPSQRSCLSTLLRSCSYLVLFGNIRMTPVVRSIANSYFPGEQKRLLLPFNHILNIPYAYLVVDFACEEDRFRIREGGLVPSHRCYLWNERK